MESDPKSMAHIPSLAKETYKQGLNVLSDAMEIGRVIHSSNNKALEKEIAGIEKEISFLNEGGKVPEVQHWKMHI